MIEHDSFMVLFSTTTGLFQSATSGFSQSRVPFVYHVALWGSQEKQRPRRGLGQRQELPRTIGGPRPAAAFIDGDMKLDVS